MKKGLTSVMVLALVMALALAVMAAQDGRLELKVGEQVYACGCGAACPCDTLAKKDGKCTCGKDLVQAKVLEVGENQAVLEIGGEQQTFKTQGKYACACGTACPCVSISQNAGKCVCGRDMAAVKH